MAPISLNIIGAGNLGKTLGRLWHEVGCFRVESVCNRRSASTRSAVEFIGAGRVASEIEGMPDAASWLIATPDDQIETVALRLARRLEEASGPAPIVFHCSGSLSSRALASCDSALLASAHPVHSFADPMTSLRSLAGCSVALEGDGSALPVLKEAFARIGCPTLSITAEKKSVYHAGSVFACNYLTGLLELSLRCFAASGISRSEATRLLRPILEQTVDNNLRLGPMNALSGPIARGDVLVVEAQLRALSALDEELVDAYRLLGKVCLSLAQQKRSPSELDSMMASLLRKD